MGGGCDHMNVMQKSYMGWLQGCNVTTITTSGTFNLVPTELPCNGIQALQFLSSTGQYYYLEYRQSYSFDAGREGVLVHVGNDIGFSQNPNILYGAAESGQGFMREGESFVDPGGSVTFTIVEEHPTHAVISVDFADGGDGAQPQCEDGETITMEGGNWGTLSCAPEPFPLDKNPPTVEITYPADGDVFPIGANFIMTAEASDDEGVTELTLYLDNEPLFSTFEPPWEWEIENIPEGTYQFGVLAWDGPNNAPSNGGQAITIYVTDDPPASDDTGDSGDSGGVDDTGPVDPTVPVGDETGDDGSSSDTDSGENVEDDGCQCRAQSRTGAPLGTLLMLGAIFGWRRRRRG
jgi:MYXO-CTERM domain-containing protein